MELEDMCCGINKPIEGRKRTQQAVRKYYP